jgi:cytochrome c553
MSGHSPTSQQEAVRAFHTHEPRADATRIVASLSAGLDTLTNLMLDRVAVEPGTRFGVDSMIMPTSFVQGHAIATLECELYQAVVAAESVHAHGYLPAGDDWFGRWLVSMRLPDRLGEPAVIARFALYKAQPPDTRRLSLETALERALPQTSHAPLVLFQLYPLAVDIVTATAFAAPVDAADARRRQRQILPSLADCTACHGELLENGEKCRQCGNPLWKYDWLTAE